MDFDRLRTFTSLEEGGVSVTARRLWGTQPAVSRMLQTLEEQIGAESIAAEERCGQPPLDCGSSGMRATSYVHATRSRQLLRRGVSRSVITAGYQQAQPLPASANGWQKTVAVSAF